MKHGAFLLIWLLIASSVLAQEKVLLLLNRHSCVDHECFDQRDAGMFEKKLNDQLNVRSKSMWFDVMPSLEHAQMLAFTNNAPMFIFMHPVTGRVLMTAFETEHFDFISDFAFERGSLKQTLAEWIEILKINALSIQTPNIKKFSKWLVNQKRCDDLSLLSSWVLDGDDVEHLHHQLIHCRVHLIKNMDTEVFSLIKFNHVHANASMAKAYQDALTQSKTLGIHAMGLSSQQVDLSIQCDDERCLNGQTVLQLHFEPEYFHAYLDKALDIKSSFKIIARAMLQLRQMAAQNVNQIDQKKIKGLKQRIFLKNVDLGQDAWVDVETSKHDIIIKIEDKVYQKLQSLVVPYEKLDG